MQQRTDSAISPTIELSNLIEEISAKRLGLKDVEPDIIGRSYEYLIRKFAEGAGRSAGEFYTPAEVGRVMARIMDPEPGIEIYDPCCGSAGLLIKCHLALDEKLKSNKKKNTSPLRLFGQENEAGTWAMANMNMIIHDMEGEIQIGDTFRSPKFRSGNRLKTFDRIVANPMWNQDEFEEKDYDADELDRFPKGAGFPGAGSADWGWMQIILASLKKDGRAAVVLDTGAASRGSGGTNRSKEKDVRRWFVEQDLIDGVIYLPENLFYNTSAPGIIIVLNRAKPKERKDRLFLINASHDFVKGDPKNHIPDEAIIRISNTFNGWRELEGYSKIVSRAEIEKSHFNISPDYYIADGTNAQHRPIATIIDELRVAETESAEASRVVHDLLAHLGI